MFFYFTSVEEYRDYIIKQALWWISIYNATATKCALDFVKDQSQVENSKQEKEKENHYNRGPPTVALMPHEITKHILIIFMFLP